MRVIGISVYFPSFEQFLRRSLWSLKCLSISWSCNIWVVVFNFVLVRFYRERTVNFFKDRHYLREEFGELMPAEVLADPKRWVDELESGLPEVLDLSKALERKTVLLELGCAVGNGLIPMLRANPDLFGVGCDLSAEAVNLLRSKDEYRCGRCFAFPSDITKGRHQQPTAEHRALEEQLPANSVDFATLLFVLSAIDPSQYAQTLQRIYGVLKPGGMVLVRDYGRGDLAQLRFGTGHWMGGDRYVRGDGTLAVFLTDSGLREMFQAAGYVTLSCEYKRTEVTNRGTGVVMPRVWVQGRFQRPVWQHPSTSRERRGGGRSMGFSGGITSARRFIVTGCVSHVFQEFGLVLLDVLFCQSSLVTFW